MSNITRKTFFKLVGGSAVAALAACVDNKKNYVPDAAAVEGCATGNASVMIAMNHVHGPHELTVSSADVAAGADKTYEIQGMASHCHMVTLTADQFATLKSGGSVMDTSTVTLSHSHVCTISCG